MTLVLPRKSTSRSDSEKIRGQTWRREIKTASQEKRLSVPDVGMIVMIAFHIAYGINTDKTADKA